MLYLVIILFLLLIGCVVKKNMIISLFFIGVLIYIFTNVNSQIPDYGNYFQYYYGGEYYRNLLQPGYESLSIFFLNHGFSFENFRLLIALFTLLIIYLAIILWTKNIALVLGFYLISYFPMDIIQIRNFAMLGFTTLAITVLVKKSKIKYIISICLIYIGSQFHTMALIYLPAILISIFPDTYVKQIRKYCVPMAIIGCVVMFFGSGTTLIGPLAGFIGRLTGNESQITNKLIERYSTGTSFSMMLSVILVNFIVFIVLNKISHYEANNISNYSMLSVINVVANLASYGVILSPLMVIAPDYSRIFRDFNLIYIIFFITTLNQLTMKKESKSLALICLLIMSISGIAVWVRYFNVLF